MLALQICGDVDVTPCAGSLDSSRRGVRAVVGDQRPLLKKDSSRVFYVQPTKGTNHVGKIIVPSVQSRNSKSHVNSRDCASCSVR